MESFINIGSQILFLLGATVFLVYSIIGIYALNAYGRSKSLTSTATIIYSAVAAGLMTWGLYVIFQL